MERLYKMRHPSAGALKLHLPPSTPSSSANSRFRAPPPCGCFPIYGAGCLLRPICALVKMPLVRQRLRLCPFHFRGRIPLRPFSSEKASAPRLRQGPLEHRQGHPPGLRPLLVCHRTAHGTGNPVPAGKRSIKSGKYRTTFPITRGMADRISPARYFRFLN